MKILVTGGTGVIGTGVVPVLLGAGHEVRLLTRHAARDARAFPGEVQAFEADLGNPEELPSALDGCDAVIHIAGVVEESPPEVTFEKVNVGGTRHLLEAAAETGKPRFIYVSSLGADRGESEYHQSKRKAEELVRHYEGDWLILRPGNVYGPGDDTISMLLKMVRTLPAVPMVEGGDQPFQPLWFSDFASVVKQAVEREDLNREALEVAGADVTTTTEVLDRLAEITDRNPPRLAVPVWLAQIGAHAMDAFGAAGKRLMRAAGIGEPINSAKLGMLLEGNVIAEGRPNALTEVFKLTPTSLKDGLELLADLLPEQMPGEGVGALKLASYSAVIADSAYDATRLLDLVCERITEVMPMEFSAEPHAPTSAKEGETLTLEIKGRGKVQVRLEERTPNRATFLTIEGHPLAGVMQLHARETPDGVEFAVHTAAQPANVFDWVALRTLGETMQSANWRSVVRRVVELSGGRSRDGVHKKSHKMSDEETNELRSWLDRLVQRQQRVRSTELAATVDAEERRNSGAT